MKTGLNNRMNEKFPGNRQQVVNLSQFTLMFGCGDKPSTRQCTRREDISATAGARPGVAQPTAKSGAVLRRRVVKSALGRQRVEAVSAIA
jgi:hypothetical protein